MSTTYSVSKVAAAMVAADGRVFYTLFEELYESNVYPHTPHWCAVFFGSAEACMRDIIRSASCCEGGGLKERGGDVSPSAYIKHWRDALQSPALLTAKTAKIRLAPGYYGVDAEKRADIERILAKHGVSIAGDDLELPLAEYADLIADLSDGHLSIWKMISSHHFDRGSDATWASYNPPVTSPPLPQCDIRVFTYSDKSYHGHSNSTYWVNRGDGNGWIDAGWEYSVIKRLIRTIAISSEAAYPGSAENTIKKIRALVKAATPISTSWRIEVSFNPQSCEWQREEWKKLLSKLNCQPTDRAIATTMGAISNADALYQLQNCAGTVSFPDYRDLLGSQQGDLLLAA